MTIPHEVLKAAMQRATPGTPLEVATMQTLRTWSKTCGISELESPLSSIPDIALFVLKNTLEHHATHLFMNPPK